MATQSKFPNGENLSKPLTAYLQLLEGDVSSLNDRVPSNTTPLDPGATLADVIAAFNQLIIDLNQ